MLPTHARCGIPKPLSDIHHSGWCSEVGSAARLGPNSYSVRPRRIMSQGNPKRSGSSEETREAPAGGHWASLTNCGGSNLLEGVVCADVFMLFDQVLESAQMGSTSPRRLGWRQAPGGGRREGFDRCVSHDGET